MSRFLKIGEAAKILGVSIQTLRRWEEEEYLLPHHKSNGKTRYYSLDELTQKSIPETSLTVAYARVSSHDQKKDLERQANALEIYCMQKGWNFQVIKDLGFRNELPKKGPKNASYNDFRKQSNTSCIDTQRSLASFWRGAYICSLRSKANRSCHH
jgi:putative resolvase